MEFVDKLNNKRQSLNKISERSEKILGEYRQSVHTWIMNSKGEFLIQKRTPNKRTFPNKWSQTGRWCRYRRNAFRSCTKRM